MSIKNLLVAFNGSQSSVAALNVALLMHQKYGAHVTGLLAHKSDKIQLSEQPWMPENLRKTISQLEDQADTSIRKQFMGLCDDRVQPGKIHWISRKGHADTTVAQYARMFDLVIVGRYDTVLGTSDLNLHPDRIAVRSGRPILVIPKDFQPQRINEHAVIAWDGQRAVARAVFEAMQILETKSLIDVISIEDGRIAKPLDEIGVKTMLERHVDNVSHHKLAVNGSTVGKVMVDFCNKVDAGLLVMGAYEHSKFAHDMFGGVTTDVIRDTRVPVLMSH